VVSPLFSSARDPKSPELLALNDIRVLWSAYHRGSPIIVSADTTPGIFALAFEKALPNQDLELKLPREWILAHPTVRLVECKADIKIATLQAKGKFPGNTEGTLETYLFVYPKSIRGPWLYCGRGGPVALRAPMGHLGLLRELFSH